MRFLGLGILGVGAVLAAVFGWQDIWHILRAARVLALIGWFVGMVGLALLVGRRKAQSQGRLALGVVLTALGLALMAVPSDARGLLTGLRVGYAGSLLAVLPHSWRLYRTSTWRQNQVAHRKVTKEVL